MAADIVHLQIGRPLPALPDELNRGIYAVAWRADIPLGAKMIKPGDDRAILHDWLGAFESTKTSSAKPVSPSAPRITVAICTRDRPTALRACLQASCNQHYDNFDILVVDNGECSNESLRELCREFGASYTAESRPGVVPARNRAVAEADGELIAFIDDDCIPSPAWLRCVAAEFSHCPAAACCTGPILPRELETPAQELMEFRGGFTRGFERRVYTEQSGKANRPPIPCRPGCSAAGETWSSANTHCGRSGDSMNSWQSAKISTCFTGYYVRDTRSFIPRAP
ncbi:glycosyltransferase family 2 protein [Proteobacteria bacterium 005FR1]|nr:glycosyltransferase family 2 protein [Proteobacteria bacterium 005FR1]